MKIRNLKIGNLLIFGFAITMLFVIALGIVAYRQADLIHQQAETMYNHPLQVRKALGELNANILTMRLATRDLMLAKTETERQNSIQAMKLAEINTERQFIVLNERFLGNISDVENAHQAFIRWNILRQENNKLVLQGEVDKVKENVSSKGEVGKLRNQMLAKIKIIDDFAKNKTEVLHTNSDKVFNQLNEILFTIVTLILLLLFIISYYLLKNIRTPIKELISATKLFEEGDMNARSKNDSTNEFGVLSASFNSMVEKIKTNADLDEKISNLSNIMLNEEDPRTFFRVMLSALCKNTNAQMAAVYLLSNDKKQFTHYESIGMDDSTKIEFSALNLEGEFGAVIASKKIQFIKNIPIDTRFVFQTVSGKFIPREIVTIPILVGKELTAIISMASVRSFSEQSILLIDNILATLNARVAGILAFRKMKNFSEKLELQNIELESQTSELEAQSNELYEQNRELEMQKNQLHEASKLKTNFLSNMSHELRTPLNSVIALSGVLNRRLATLIPEEEYSYLEVIERNGKNLLSLINDILDISRIESGREETEITKFNINNLIADIASMIHPQAAQKNVELIQLDIDNELIIATDSTKCRHILQNLIANAVKFTEIGKVEIIASKTAENIEIRITDTGIGIPKKHLPHIFDEFRQADGSTSRRFGGTGLGLAIAKKYTHFLGGNIVVESTIDVGSCFILSLPIYYDAESIKIEHEVNTRYSKTIQQKNYKSYETKTILLVEDSEPAIIQLKDFMEESGYKILVAQNGAEALDIINQTIPDAMILDLMMPDIDGFKVLETLRNAERTAQIPVLILTAKQITKDDLKFLKRNNIHQLIQKGDVNRIELLEAVSSMVNTDMIDESQLKSQREFSIINGKPLVLVVEDNPDNMITIKAVLGNKFDVIEATDGIEGITMAVKHEPNLILMDIALPRIDGIQAFNTIRGNAKLQHIPVIAITASAMTSDRETILSHGFDGYIAKPIDEKVFFRIINKVLFGT